MKTIVFTIFLVHSSWANWCPTKCGCKSDYKYDLDVTLKRNVDVCGVKKGTIKEGWDLDKKKDHFKCQQRTGLEWKGFGKMELLDQPNAETFNKDKDGKSRTPTTGRYKICLEVKCRDRRDCIVTLTKNGSGGELLIVENKYNGHKSLKNGSGDELLIVESIYGNHAQDCVVKELKNTDKVQVNYIPITYGDNDIVCLDTEDKANNRLTITLEEKTKGEP